MHINIPLDSSRDLLQEDEFMIEDEYLLTPSQLNTLAKIDEQDAAYLHIEQKAKERLGLYSD
ncbi:hypothetical protein ES703_83609 [subsurface metagenome]